MTKQSSKLSKAIRRQLTAIDSQTIVAAAVKTVTLGGIGDFEHVGLTVKDGRITAHDPAPPPRTCGAYAARNLDGWDEKLKDLPKEARDISSWAPNGMQVAII